MIETIKRGYEPATERDLFTLALASLDELTSGLRLSTPRFVCFLAWDVAEVADDAIARVAARLLDAGAVYFVVWGSDCKRAHDIIDDKASQTGRNRDDAVIMTSWHAAAPLTEALWEFLHASLPDQPYSKDCSTGLAISIGMPQSTVEEVAAALEDSSEWTRRVLDSEADKHAT